MSKVYVQIPLNQSNWEAIQEDDVGSIVAETASHFTVSYVSQAQYEVSSAPTLEHVIVEAPEAAAAAGPIDFTKDLKSDSKSPTVLVTVEWKPINMNDPVRVKLNDLGRRTIDENHAALYGTNAHHWPADHRKPDEDGYVEYQLWELAQVFGHKLGNGRPVPFETMILLRTETPS